MVIETNSSHFRLGQSHREEVSVASLLSLRFAGGHLVGSETKGEIPPFVVVSSNRISVVAGSLSQLNHPLFRDGNTYPPTATHRTPDRPGPGVEPFLR